MGKEKIDMFNKKSEVEIDLSTSKVKFTADTERLYSITSRGIKM
jgi:hypothetical protein